MLTGGCHCGKIQFQVETSADLELSECNCSICYMSGYLHLIVPRAAFRLLRGEKNLMTYQFNTRIAKHYFCRYCGVKSFYVPRSHPEGISVNARCIDRNSIRSTTVTQFDGAHWEQNAHGLRPLPG